VPIVWFFAHYTCQQWEQGFINTDDAFRTTAVENLAQVHLVRASFASDYMSAKLTDKADANMRSESALWTSYHIASFILSAIYLGSLFLLLAVLSWQVHHGIISFTCALGLAVTYTQSTSESVVL